jgi:hypothetical protein
VRGWFKLLWGYSAEPVGAYCLQALGLSVRGDLWASAVEILVFASPTGYMLTSFRFSFIKLRLGLSQQPRGFGGDWALFTGAGPKPVAEGLEAENLLRLQLGSGGAGLS